MKFIAILVSFTLWGCSGTKAPPADTGAKSAAIHFYEIACGPDPRAGYRLLDAQSQKKMSAERFVDSAKQYAKNLGFPVEKISVRTCDERGDEAKVHLTLAGHGKRFNDGITLNRRGEQWAVVLPANFGHATK